MGTPRTTTPAPVSRPAIYARISKDENGDGLAVARQVKLCRELAARRGWPDVPAGAVYTDDAISAYKGTRRPAFERLMDDVEAGTVDAIAVVDVDRLYRRMRELVRVIDVCDRAGAQLANVGGDFDLSTSDGRMRAHMLGAIAEFESAKKGERQMRANAQRADMGAAHGRPPFGYRKVRRPVDGVVLATFEIVELEARLVRDAAARWLAGESLRSIARDMDGRGVRAMATTIGLRTILTNPVYAGIRIHRGERVGDGAWEPILDRATHERLAAKGRQTARNGGDRGRPAVSLLSGIVVCGLCRTPMYTTSRDGGVRRYGCLKRPGSRACGRVAIVAAQTDDLVADLVLDALAGRATGRAFARRAGETPDVERLTGELAAAEGRLEEIAAAFAAGEIGRAEWNAGREVANRRVAEIRAVIERETADTTIANLPTGADALRVAWDEHAGDVEWRRAVIRSVVNGITVKPATRTGRGYDMNRIDPDWKV